MLLENGANPNSQTSRTSSTADKFGLEGEINQVTQQTPLHLALENNNSDIVQIFLQHKGILVK